jgi:hypothetical protein
MQTARDYEIRAGVVRKKRRARYSAIRDVELKGNRTKGEARHYNVPACV